MNIFTGHDPSHDLPGFPGEGCDLLLHVWDDGPPELAVRPGEGRGDRTWGPPTLLWPESSEVVA